MINQNSLPNQKPEERLGLLLRFPTVSYPNREGEDEEAFRGFEEALEGLYPLIHARCEKIRVAPRGLIFRLRGKSSEKPVVLMAHFDVVPAPPEGWDRDPFSGAVEGGFIHGRGALDTKGTLCAQMEALEVLLSEGFSPKEDLCLCYSGDEETFGPSCPAIIRKLNELDLKPDLVLDEGNYVLDNALPGLKGPTAMLGVAEKGLAQISIAASGRGGHSSRPPRIQQAETLARAILRLSLKPSPFTLCKPIRRLAALAAQSGRVDWPYSIVYHFPRLFKPLILQEINLRGGEFAAMFRTTRAVTRLEGSQADNVLPRVARAGVNLRLLPGDTPAMAFERVKKILKGLPVEVSLCYGNDPSPVSRCEGPAWDRLCGAVKSAWAEAIPLPSLVLGATDAVHYSAFCDQVYRFSPFRLEGGLSLGVHAANERLPVTAFHEAIDFYRAFINRD